MKHEGARSMSSPVRDHRVTGLCTRVGVKAFRLRPARMSAGIEPLGMTWLGPTTSGKNTWNDGMYRSMRGVPASSLQDGLSTPT